jgi:hypothetical protein
LKEVRTEIEIHASARKVWDIISDFSRYSEWNPFIMRAQGEPREGSKITIDVRTPAGAHRIYNPRVIKAEPEKELRWVGKVPGIVSGEHSLTIEQLDGNRVRLANNEVFGGLLSSFFGGSIEDIKAGFEQMNQALKKRAEG